DYRLSSALTSLGTGEAIVTVLSERGAPTPVTWTRVRAPRSLMAPAPAGAVAAAVVASPLNATYGQPVDRQSAYEMLTARLAPSAGAARFSGHHPDGADPPNRADRVGDRIGWVAVVDPRA
ncbi:MAG TPA: helicase HerA-like domain-containing protein, partial [Nakamurella sp.]|nr:helicase HerA-like domain-containing protein [Nakamurella sp.]